MRRKAFYIFILLLVQVIAKGQITFQKIFVGVNYNVGRTILQTIDGGFVLGGESGLGGISDNFCLLKMDSLGNEVWTKSYNSGDEDVDCNSIQQTSDGGFIMAGITWPDYIYTYVIKTNSTGDTLWTRILWDGYDVYASSIIQSSDDGYVLTGTVYDTINNNEDVFVVKLDSMGNLLWANAFRFSDDSFGKKVLQCGDGSIILLADFSHLGSSEICLLKIDSVGNLLWTKSYGGVFFVSANSILQSGDNGFFISGLYQENSSTSSGLVLKIDSTGTVMWSKRIGGQYRENFFNADNCFDNGFILSGFSQSFSDSLGDIYLVKIDSIGNVLWTKTYGGVTQDYGWSVSQTSDSGFVFGGTTNGLNQIVPPEAYIIKADNLGNSGCNEVNVNSTDSLISLIVYTPIINSYVPGIVELNRNTTISIVGTLLDVCTGAGIFDQIISAESIIIKPNPAINFFNILKASGSKIALLDIRGSVIMSSIISRDEESINIENLSSGIYFVQLQTPNGFHIKKLIKQ